MAADRASNPFWDFSLALYGRAAVRDACLALQDRAGADVNVALFMLWLGAAGRPVDARQAGRIAAAVADWQHSVVLPLRAARRAMKAWPVPHPEARDGVRARLQHVEIEAEEIEQAMLYRLSQGDDIAPPVGAASAGAAIARGNLLAYLEGLGGVGDEREALAGALIAASR